MKVPFIDLRREHALLRQPIAEAMRNAINRSEFILGDAVEKFENNFARFLNVPYAVGVASGTDALHLALRALDIGVGDEVIVPTMTFAATFMAVLQSGATPVLVDVEESTGLIDVKSIEKALTKRTRAVIPVHLYGQPCDMRNILGLASKHRLRVIEDACQAHGAQYDGKKVGSVGDIGCFSFYPSKNLGACGDGGMVVTSNRKVFDRLHRLRNHGQNKKHQHRELGFNSRLDSLQAAILDAKLIHLDQWNQKRRKIAEIYREKIGEKVVFPIAETNVGRSIHAYHLLLFGRSIGMNC